MFRLFQALRNAAAAFAATHWVFNLDADFIPTVETLAALRAVVRSHGYADDGSQLKRAFIVPPFATMSVFDSPLNFSYIREHLGDDASHAVNSWPEIPLNAGDERQFQCHANIDLQRWLMISQQSVSGAPGVVTPFYKVCCFDALAITREIVTTLRPF